LVKNEYEDLLNKVRVEYQLSNAELRKVIETKAEDLTDSKMLLSVAENRLKDERAELGETITKDKCTYIILGKENESLRQANTDIRQDRD
jgi:hypothetical protein